MPLVESVGDGLNDAAAVGLWNFFSIVYLAARQSKQFVSWVVDPRGRVAATTTAHPKRTK